MQEPALLRAAIDGWLNSPEIRTYYRTVVLGIPNWHVVLAKICVAIGILAYGISIAPESWNLPGRFPSIADPFVTKLVAYSCAVVGLWLLFVVIRTTLGSVLLRRKLNRCRIVLGGIVIANTALLSSAVKRAPALLVVDTGERTEGTDEDLVHASEVVAELYAMPPAQAPPNLRAFCAELKNDKHTAKRTREIPAAVGLRPGLTLVDAILDSSNTRGQGFIFPFVPCALDAKTSAFIAHLPHEFLFVMATPTSLGGSKVIRHETPVDEEIALEQTPYAEEIEHHITRAVAVPPVVLHELVSMTVHVDIYVIPPGEGRNWNTLVTSGMSSRPMTVPAGAEQFTHAELMLRLPPDWNIEIGKVTPNDAPYAWAIAALKRFSRFPHEYRTWLAASHTIPNGDPAEPIEAGVLFTGWLIADSHCGGEELRPLKCADGAVINFYSLIPVHTSEMNYKLKAGFAALMEKLSEGGVTDLIDVKRKPVV